MAFWIFMLIANLLIPFTMICFGSYFRKQAPKEINMLFGYRTKMSMKNKDTWKFAHYYCGKLWISTGFIMLVISFVAMLIVYGKSIDTIGIFAGILCMAQLVFLIGSIFSTEKALKKAFDDNGNRR